jgi:hemerythrin
MHQADEKEFHERMAMTTLNLLYQLITDLNQKMDDMIDEHRSTKEMLEDHMKGEDHLLAEFKNAFPNGDPVSHKNYHETVMEEMATRKKWRDAVIEKSLAGLIWASLAAVGTACWAYIKDHIK